MEGQVSTRTKVLHALMVVVLTIVLLLFIAPFILVVINVFKTKADINTEPLALIGKHGFTLDNFPRAMEKMNFLTVFGNSAIITISATILTILFSAMCAYVIAQSFVEVRRRCLRTYGGLHGHSVPGAHGAVGLRVWRSAQRAEQPHHADPHAYRLLGVVGGVHVPRRHQDEHPERA